MSTTAPKIFIGGGTGFIGTVLRILFQNEGYNVKVISRTPVQGGVTWSDLTLMDLPENTAAVINCSGENVLNPKYRWNETFKKKVYSSRISTNDFLVEMIKETKYKPKVFISMSGVGIYKPDPVKEYDEYTKINEGFDYISKLAIDWEKSTELPEDTDVRRVIVRSGVVLGRTGGMIKQVFPQFYLGLGGPIGDGKQFFPWIHVYDLCRMMLYAVKNEKVTGVLNGVAPEIITNNQFTKAFGKALWRPTITPLPAFAVKLIFGQERSVMMLEGQKVIPKRVQELGFDYIHPSIDSACTEFSKLFYIPPEWKGNFKQQVPEISS
ncbi:epimerase family protein SDR39U1 [Planococcus citri]|uniref:epimerase family protein SDR39U1 n=1 Tax=Planococcus citri TaxID=170843 RepID=UPI0031F902C1